MMIDHVLEWMNHSMSKLNNKHLKISFVKWRAAARSRSQPGGGESCGENCKKFYDKERHLW